MILRLEVACAKIFNVFRIKRMELQGSPRHRKRRV
jgi:hypothetical protein